MGRNGLLWLSLTQLLNLNLMDMATTGLMDTGVGEGRRDLLSPMLRLNQNLTDMDIAPMATTGPTGTGAGERKRSAEPYYGYGYGYGRGYYGGYRGRYWG